MTKATIITLQNIRNYGSALQALATQHIFEELGCEVDFINYKRANVSTLGKRLTNWTESYSFFKKIFASLLLIPSFLRQETVFKRFIKANLKQQKKVYTCIDDFKDYKANSDVYITGSDQTWNSSWNKGVLPELFLAFVPDSIKKIAYAASMGKETLDEWEIAETKKYISRYKYISVREKQAKEIIEKQLQISPITQVLDPTLQVDASFWRSLISTKKSIYTPRKYVLVYQLNSNKEFDHYATSFAQKKGWPLVRLCTRFDQFVKSGKSVLIPEVIDFVTLIANAGCVITDSFHATAFSCNLNTPMICIYPNDFNSRLSNLLSLLQLNDRHLKSYDDFSFLNSLDIDFKKINDLLKDERKKGITFLKKALEI